MLVFEICDLDIIVVDYEEFSGEEEGYYLISDIEVGVEGISFDSEFDLGYERIGNRYSFRSFFFSFLFEEFDIIFKFLRRKVVDKKIG